jgi:hypothetical protein
VKKYFALWALLLCGLLCLTQADAFFQSRDSNYNVAISGGAPAFTGPGDIVTGWDFWFGLRAFSSATRGNALVNVCNVPNSTCADFSSAPTTGNLVFADIGGVPCTASVVSGTYNSTTGAVVLTISASMNLGNENGFALSAMTGTNAATNLNITSSPFPLTTTSGTSGTTVTFTAATGLTLTITGGTISACTVQTWHDQSGSARDATQTTLNSRGVLVANCIGSLPCVTGPLDSGAVADLGYTVAAVTIAQPFSLSFVGFANTFSTTASFIGADNAGSDFSYIFESSANTWSQGGSPAISGTATDKVFHAANGVFNSTSSVLNIDGTETTGNTGTAGISSADTVHFLADGFDEALVGLANEGGILPSAESPAVRSGLCHNQHLYWGTPTSC